MGQYLCLVQEGQEPERHEAELEKELRAIGERVFGDDPAQVDVRWLRIARGFGFTAGAPSTSSLVVGSVPAGLSCEPREAFLREVSEMWSRETGCSPDEIVVTAWDGPLPV